MFYDQEKCGARIRQIRKQNGYTQERLAEELNMDRKRAFYTLWRFFSLSNGWLDNTF